MKGVTSVLVEEFCVSTNTETTRRFRRVIGDTPLQESPRTTREVEGDDGVGKRQVGSRVSTPTPEKR